MKLSSSIVREIIAITLFSFFSLSSSYPWEHDRQAAVTEKALEIKKKIWRYLFLSSPSFPVILASPGGQDEG